MELVVVMVILTLTALLVFPKLSKTAKGTPFLGTRPCRHGPLPGGQGGINQDRIQNADKP
jgi:hypothetical protein